MKVLIVAGLAAFTAVAGAADGDRDPCTAHMCGREYDLRPLSSNTDYIIESHSGRNITLNVCRGVTTELWNPRVDRPQDIGGFFRGDHGDFSIGQVNTTLLFRDMHPVIYMTGGTSCPQSESMKASTAIQFICDASAGEGEPRLAAQLPPEDSDACAFFIEWRTKHGCPLPNRYAYWKTVVMVIVILLALTLTLLALLALHKLIKRTRRSSSDIYPSTPLPNGNGSIGGIGGRRSWASGITERAGYMKRLLTGQDPWGHPNGYHPVSNPEAINTVKRNGWLSSFSFPWSRSSPAPHNDYSHPRRAGGAMMDGGSGPFSVDDDDDDDDPHRAAELNAGPGAGDFAVESAAWGAARPRGMNGEGVIRL